MSKEWYPYGYVGNTTTNEHTRVTLAQLRTKQTWSLLHSQAQERALALFDDCPEPLGCGTGWRVQSATEFKRRHFIVAGPTGLFFEGKFWKLRPGYAAYAVPGNSYHESVPPSNTAFALDFVGVLTWNGRAWVNTASANRALQWLKINCPRYGLRNFDDVNDEIWHGQLIEVPTTRKNYVPSIHVIKQWDWSFRNALPDLENYTDMNAFCQYTGDKTVYAVFDDKKIAMSNGPTMDIVKYFNSANGHPERNQVIQCDANLMRAFWPIFGPVPAGVDPWGVPL